MYLAGRSVTEGEVEEMLESGNPAVFTQGVSVHKLDKYHRPSCSCTVDYG